MSTKMNLKLILILSTSHLFMDVTGSALPAIMPFFKAALSALYGIILTRLKGTLRLLTQDMPNYTEESHIFLLCLVMRDFIFNKAIIDAGFRIKCVFNTAFRKGEFMNLYNTSNLGSV